ncbi:class E sortase [Streptomyces sp. NPDC001889]
MPLTPASDSSTETTPAKPGRRRLLAAYALLATGTLTAVVIAACTVTDDDRATSSAPSEPPSSAPSATAPSSPGHASSTPSPRDPLTETSPATGRDRAVGGDPAVPDRSGTARTQAGSALESWSNGNPRPTGDRAVGGEAVAGAGGAIREVLRIPALGRTWSQPVYDGIGDRQLRAGIGHFPQTEEPGQTGNYAIAGHRSGISDPAFRDIDNIKRGSDIHVTTADRITYTYTVTRVRTVAPTDVDVIAQVPGKPAATPTKAKLTIVTCWPANGSSKRIVVEADLTASRGGTQ